MILLITPNQNGPELAAEFKKTVREEVQLHTSVRHAVTALRSTEFHAVVADENLIEAFPGSADALLDHLGSAVPVFLDLAAYRAEKVTRELMAALRRREREIVAARAEAARDLRNELKSDITGLLISSELALKSAKNPERIAVQLTSVLEIAQRLKAKLQG